MTAAQEREIARLVQVLAALRSQLGEILARVQELRSGTLDAIQRLSDAGGGVAGPGGGHAAGSLGRERNRAGAARTYPRVLGAERRPIGIWLPDRSQQEEQIEGKSFQVQWFERNRLELHPENARPYDVLLGRLGADRLAQQGRDAFAFPKSDQQQGCRFFAETGHNICSEVLSAWRASGLELDGQRGKTEAENLGLFGLPLSGLVIETLADGKEYQVQWFERGRFELHPENRPPYQVLLGLLGKEVRGESAAPSNQPSHQDGRP